MTPFDAPSIRTPPPGPLSQEYLARQERYESNARTYPRYLPIAVRRAQGSYVEDVDGNVFLDFLAGAGVLSLGHNHPEVVAAVRAQLARYVHGLDFPTPVKDAFTAAQLGMLPPVLRDAMKVHFCGPTGANAVEAAIKLCKSATGRGDIIAFHGGFHGSTAGAMAVSGDVGVKQPVNNGLPGVHFLPYSYCRRCPLGLTPQECDTNCAAYFEHVLTSSQSGIPKPAAVILELVQGEGGVIPATPEFVRRVRKTTRDLDIPLIVDEVQTGCGRTGTWYAFERYGIEPDVIVASKALTGIGLPVALICYARALDGWAPGAHTGTFRGNQLAFAAGVAALEVIRRDDVLANVLARGAQLGAGLTALRECSPWVADVRGVGLMWGVELADPQTGAPAAALARAAQTAAFRAGLVVEVGGLDGCVVRLLPPLTVTATEIGQALAILTKVMSEPLVAGRAARV
ncbi:MAG TPA: diaminobutyrate--2-oxoglutarate transaminase family protein [Actinophytocola sp.]|jgi:diaminobutyrate-2-oxoglutarate transaminase|uniref:aspartate aminotransferase family protein n=1 Tax=Actinophytocola sp. TaxID=1872138 RepID=UPI002E0AEB75|nr:diaminobutyrate--2-oxoglutarate transaminase family protein [Actinophytocola sp.]